MRYQKKVLLMGGMGNKFFQIARALELERKNVVVELVFIDLSMRGLYKLSGHTIHGDWLDVVMLVRQLGINVRPISFVELISLSLKFALRKLAFPVRFDENLEDALILDSNFFPSAWDIGYFQSDCHLGQQSLKQVSDALISFMAIKKNDDTGEMVCHIRGGDFGPKNRINKNYIAALVDLCKSQSLKLMVVTNDAVFCRELFESHLYELYIGKSAADDFIKLASSSNLYLSNSTFAFWAALISVRSHNAVVHVPENWSYSKFLSGA